MSLVINSAALEKRQPEAHEDWRDYQPGVKFLIRGINHRFVQIGLQAKREHQAQIFARINRGDLTALKQGKTEDEIGNETIAELVVADWSGLTLESGEELPYSTEAAMAIFSDPEHYDLAIWAMAEAAKISREASERMDARLGKSSPATDGKLNEKS